MASIQRYKTGWRAQIAKDGIRRSKTFPSKQQAQDWAAREEYLIRNGVALARGEPFGTLLDRYAREVSPGKRGHRWEVVRLEKLQRDRIAKKAVGSLTAKDFADWRDRRMKEVSAATVRREMGLMGAVLTQARLEWGIVTQNVLHDVRKPAPAPSRQRLPTADEIERLRQSAGPDLSKRTARAFHAFLFAMETAMRAGEIIGLTWRHVDLVTRVAHLPRTKNGQPRDVPLSTEAVRLLEALPKQDPVFGLSSQQLDVLFRKLRERAAVDGLRFHDSRAEATTRLARKVDVLDLARITGHRDIKMLMVYYRETAADIAKKLD